MPYIARLRADAPALVKMMVAVGRDLPRDNFDAYCKGKNCLLPQSQEQVTLHRLVQTASRGGVSALDAVSAFLLNAKLQVEVQKLLTEVIPLHLVPGLIRVVTGRFSLSRAIDFVEPEFKKAGLPFYLVRDGIKKIIWDHTAGTAGIWRKLRPGSFMMGAPQSARRVEITAPFLVSVFPFTNGQMLALPEGKKICEKAGVNLEHYSLDDSDPPFYIRTMHVGVGPNLDLPSGRGLSLPLVGVSQQTSRSIAALDGASLPLEKQWEYAARYDGPRSEDGVVLGYRYPTGPSLEAADGSLLAHVYHQDEGGKWTSGTAPVGSYPREVGSGLYDMGGNVMEWVEDGLGSKGGFWSRGLYTLGCGVNAGKLLPDREGAEMLATHAFHLCAGRSPAAWQGLRLVLA